MCLQRESMTLVEDDKNFSENLEFAKTFSFFLEL